MQKENLESSNEQCEILREDLREAMRYLEERIGCKPQLAARRTVDDTNPQLENPQVKQVLPASALSNVFNNADVIHKHKLSARLNLPQEGWDKTTSHLSPSSALKAVDVFKFKSSAYDRVWAAVFQREDWAESKSAEDANIVLIGADLDILSGLTVDRARPRLVLAVFDRRGNLQYKGDLLLSSLRGDSLGSEEHQLEQLTLVMSRLDVPEVLGKDFSYLFCRGEQEIQTKYCYWRDPEKKIRTLYTQDIRGIDGPVARIEDLRPIFLLNLNPPMQSLPEDAEPLSSRSGDSGIPVQFIFRCFGGSSFWTGRPPLVHAMLGEGGGQGQCEHTFKGFTFKDEKYGTYHRQDTDWVRVAEAESGQKCDAIETS